VTPSLAALGWTAEAAVPTLAIDTMHSRMTSSLVRIRSSLLRGWKMGFQA
jgi:hypothetical protein